MTRLAQAQLLAWWSYEKALQMNGTARLLLAIVLCVAAVPVRALSAALEDKWEHDPVPFTTRERSVIRAYYGAASTRPGSGARKRDKGVPAVAVERLQRNSILPVGSQRRIRPLSTELEQQLRPLYSGYSRGTIGRDVVIVQDRTLRITDVIRDVTGRR